jgi:sugar lactone lactonase YvrE
MSNSRSTIQSLRQLVPAVLALLCASLAGRVQAQTLYVANSAVHSSESPSIEEYAPDGTPSVFADTGLNNPSGLAFDSAGDLFVTNYGNNTIEKFAPNGTPSLFASGLNNPAGVVVGPSGNVYVANDGNNTIEEFSPSGTPSVFASTGLNYPEALAFGPSGDLYVANDGNDTIEEFSSSGTDLGAFATSGLSAPASLAFDTSGNLYAANALSSTIEKFTPSGTPSVFVADPDDASLSEPTGLAFNQAGVLYVVGLNLQISEYSSSGAYVGDFSHNGLNSPTALAFDLVPEPSSFAMFLLGLAVLFIVAHGRHYFAKAGLVVDKAAACRSVTA